MGYVVFLAVGLLFFTVGLWSNGCLMRVASEYARSAPTESGCELRDRTIGHGLFSAWASIIIGSALILFTLYRFVVDNLI